MNVNANDSRNSYMRPPSASRRTMRTIGALEYIKRCVLSGLDKEQKHRPTCRLVVFKT